VKARLDGAAGLAHALRDDDQIVDGVANLQPEQREQDKHGDNEEVGDDAVGEAVRNVWVEAHGPLLPTATGSSRGCPGDAKTLKGRRRARHVRTRFTHALGAQTCVPRGKRVNATKGPTGETGFPP
jgi:hypothetical protein